MRIVDMNNIDIIEYIIIIFLEYNLYYYIIALSCYISKIVSTIYIILCL